MKKREEKANQRNSSLIDEKKVKNRNLSGNQKNAGTKIQCMYYR